MSVKFTFLSSRIWHTEHHRENMERKAVPQGVKTTMTQEKVLIVEDEENERTGLAELVQAWGYKTDTAKDGLEALEKVVAWSPGIVVTDLKMPRMDGMELLERLAEQPQPIAVVLLTAQGSIDAAVDAMKL